MRWPATPKDSHRNTHSTTKNAGGLYFWDRNETRCDPSAMVAEPITNEHKRSIKKSTNNNQFFKTIHYFTNKNPCTYFTQSEYT